MKTLASHSGSHAGNPYLVILHTSVSPDPGEWQAYVAKVRAAMSAAASGRTVHAFAVTDGAGPSSTQRKEVADAFALGNADAVTHVFTDSAFVRGIVTTFHWMGWSPAVAHSPLEFAAVCSGCGVPPAIVLADLARLQAQLPPVQILEQIERSLREARGA